MMDGGEGEIIVNAWPLRFSAAGREWAVRQPRCEERDDARAIYRMYEALWGGRPEIQALADMKPTDEELQAIEGAIDAARKLLERVEHPAHKAALKQRIVALQRQRKTWNRAQEIVAERAALARDRWLTLRLLMEPDGRGGFQPVFDPSNPADAEKWESFDDVIREAARPAIWQALRFVEDGRFFSGTRSAPA